MDRNGCSIGTHILSYKPSGLKMDCRYFWLLLWVEITHSRQKLPKGAQQIAEKGIGAANDSNEMVDCCNVA